MLQLSGNGADPLGADDLGLFFFRVVKDDRQIARRTIQMRLDDLQNETRSHGGVKGIAAFFEDAKTHGRGDPMG